MGRQTTNDNTTKAAALKLLRRGLITPPEAARLTGASRQLVRHWIQDISVRQARIALVDRIWRREIDRRG